MEDHTPDPRFDEPSPCLVAPMAYDASTRHHRSYTHVHDDSSDSSGTTVSLDIGNRYPKPRSSAHRRRRRRGKMKSSIVSDLSLPVRSISARCWYVPVILYGMKLRFLFDSGADVSIVPYDRYLSIPDHLRPILTPLPVDVHGASGHSLDVRGTCRLPLEIGGTTYDVDCTIVGSDCPAILGMNFMREFDVEADFGRGMLRVNSATVCLFHKRAPRGYAVELATDVDIPPHHEAVAHVKAVELGSKWERRQRYSGVITPLDSFSADTGLVLGRTLVKSGSGPMPVLVVNPNPYPVRVGRKSVVGNVSPVDTILDWSPANHARNMTDDGSVSSSSSSDSEPEGGATPFRVHNVQVEHSNCSGKATSDAPQREALTPQELAPELARLVDATDLTDSQKEEVSSLLRRYQGVFSLPGSVLGRTSLVRHKIDTGRNPPIRQKARRIPAGQQPIYEEEMRKMRDLDIIEPSDSPWASPTVLVKKKDGTMRFCVDYRRLNDATIKDSYPLPNIEDTFDSLNGAKYFCALDLASGYWQVEVAPEDRHKTAFLTREGLWQFKVMPFGLCNAPATFERLMEMILRGLLWKRCLVYIDDIIAYGRDFEDTLENLSLVLQRIKDAGLKLKPKKCELFTEEILYLGFKVSGKGVKPDPSKIEAVVNWPVPNTVTKVRAFMGFANYHRRFIKNFAQVARPLLKLTNKGQPFIWGHEQDLAFLELKSLLTTCPMLSHPVPGAKFILDTDASAFALGGVLSQVVDGQEKVIAYSSKALSRTEVNYCTTHRELLAVVRMTNNFRHYLWGRKFLLRTDHSSLRWLLHYRDADGMLARWLAKLQTYDFDIEHRPGLQHGNADGLSRCDRCKNPSCVGTFRPEEMEKTSSDSEFDVAEAAVRPVGMSGTFPEYQQDETGAETFTVAPQAVGRNLVDMDMDWSSGQGLPSTPDSCLYSSGGAGDAHLPPLMTKTHLSSGRLARVRKLDIQLARNWLSGYSPSDLSAAQSKDPDISPVLAWVKDSEKPDQRTLGPFSAATKTLVSQWRLLIVRDDCLYRTAMRPSTGDKFYQLVVPLTLRSLVLEQLHDLRIVGHLGIARTLSRLQERYYWPCMAIDVARWCAACHDCAARKGKPPPGRAPLAPLPVGAPFERIALDILDTHIPTRKGFVYILVISDYFTKYTDAFPLRNKTAYLCAKTLMERWIVYHGVPTVVHSDQGREFEGRVFKHLVEMLGATKTRTAPYRPQSDGLVERFNRTLLNMLSVFVHDNPTDWDEHLPYVLSAYRSSVHSSTNCTPNSLVYARDTNLPLDLILPTSRSDHLKAQNYPQYVQWIRQALQSAHTFARKHLGKALVRQKRNYDSYAKSRPTFALGSLVRYFYTPAKHKHKFSKPWLGPFEVLEQVTPVDYRIRRVGNPVDTRVVHVDHLKPYEAEQVSDEGLGLPPLVLDWDYTDPALLQDQEDYMELIQPLFDVKDNPSVTESDESTDVKHPLPLPSQGPHSTPLAQRRPKRTIKPPNRFGYSSNPITCKSVYWF